MSEATDQGVRIRSAQAGRGFNVFNVIEGQYRIINTKTDDPSPPEPPLPPQPLSREDERTRYLSERLAQENKTNQIAANPTNPKAKDILSHRNYRAAKARTDPRTGAYDIPLADIGTARALKRLTEPKLGPYDDFYVDTHVPGTDKPLCVKISTHGDTTTITGSEKGNPIGKIESTISASGHGGRIDTTVTQDRNMPPFAPLMREIIRDLCT